MRLLEVLRATDTHPTAAWLHEALRTEFQNLSLGTVYRNLEVLADQGEINRVSCAGPAVRYDGNVATHHHFLCDDCGTIYDIDLPDFRALPRGMAGRIRRLYRLHASSVRMDFHGQCENCADGHSDKPKSEEKPQSCH